MDALFGQQHGKTEIAISRGRCKAPTADFARGFLQANKQASLEQYFSACSCRVCPGNLQRRCWALDTPTTPALSFFVRLHRKVLPVGRALVSCEEHLS